ncbi:uncharacterized protein LOC133783895 isoform X1 [Humulus lupulus]|uniref:uncharacterized protein LOC133783895 isoform X1 n=1 Tax=Humulus lupulus TaxID=3486 RepID=UPI002B4050C8|nr:uncharacterized protein LOC133783895 isoform X1 [Humulus lupulus]
MSMNHFSHQHSLSPLTWRPGFPKFSCGLCNHLIKSGENFYDCWDCYDYHIHERCAELPEHITNSLHDQHPLTLLEKRSNPSTICCSYCNKSIEDELYVYTCEECAFYVHITCASIPLPTITCDGCEDQDIVHFSCHQQPMVLVEFGGGKDVQGNNCFVCRLPWSNPSYSCTSLTCMNFLHESCAELPQKINHPFHSHQPLKLQISKPPACDVCCKKDCRVIFRCHEIGCDFKLGTECAYLHTTVRCRSHDHLLAFVENSSCDNIQCDACLNSYNGLNDQEVIQTRSLQFCCMECDYKLHFICGPLPSMIKYDYHIHCLSLVDSLIEDDFDEYYCDACEKERNLQFRVYRCDDCKYTAHVHCIIDEILKTLKGETNTNNNNNEVELRALGEFQWNWSTEMDQAKDHHHQTLGEIMYTLTQEEKKRLAHPVDLCYKLGYNRYRNLNSQFDELRSLENFDKFKEFFQSEYDDFWNEVYFYTSEEGFKVEEKYSRQEVVEVAGKYMVPKTLSPILKTLIQKYGDLDGQSSLSSGMRSVISTLLSIVIDKMCRTKIENITMDDMHEWHFYILGIEKISGFNLYGIRSILYKECMSAYLGFKAIRCEKEVPKKLDMKIATLEAELEKFKKMREELPTIMSHKSSTTLERLSKAAKWKNKTLGDAWF